MMMMVIKSNSRCVKMNACHIILNIRWAKWKLKYLLGVALLIQYK